MLSDSPCSFKDAPLRMQGPHWQGLRRKETTTFDQFFIRPAQCLAFCTHGAISSFHLHTEVLEGMLATGFSQSEKEHKKEVSERFASGHHLEGRAEWEAWVPVAASQDSALCWSHPQSVLILLHGQG